MTLAAPSIFTSSSPGSGGESTVARFVDEKVREGKRAFYETYTFGHAYYNALSDLVSVKRECSMPNWDGYGGSPVRSETVWQAWQVLESLPPGIPEPTIGAEPDGDVTMEWYQSPRRTLSVSVSAEGLLHYSALIGPNKQFGTEAFPGELPTTIGTLIRRVLA
jgi:hypothetical protein